MGRYYITEADLKAAALTLQVGAGIAARLNTIDTSNFIDQGETWAEDQVELAKELQEELSILL
jgi:hypothetical protein